MSIFSTWAQERVYRKIDRLNDRLKEVNSQLERYGQVESLIMERISICEARAQLYDRLVLPEASRAQRNQIAQDKRSLGDTTRVSRDGSIEPIQERRAPASRRSLVEEALAQPVQPLNQSTSWRDRQSKPWHDSQGPSGIAAGPQWDEEYWVELSDEPATDRIEHPSVNGTQGDALGGEDVARALEAMMEGPSDEGAQDGEGLERSPGREVVDEDTGPVRASVIEQADRESGPARAG